MPIKLMAVCSNGHLSDYVNASEFYNKNYDLSNSNISDALLSQDEYKYISVDRYCENCGAEVHTWCPNCESDIFRDISEGEQMVSGINIPDYCSQCGDDYPWVTPVEEAKQRDSVFIEISDSGHTGPFYTPLISEINTCYQVQADEATLVLTRKVIENLLLEVIRTVEGMDNLEVFYNTDIRQSKSLGSLISAFSDRLDKFDKYTSGIDDGLVQDMNDIKHQGDASAHSIETSISEDELESLSETATEVCKLLLRLRTEVKTVHS